MLEDGGFPPTHGWPIPFSNSFSALASPGSSSTPTPPPFIARTHPIKDMRRIDIKILFIFFTFIKE
jgi:hypothetical protein